MTGLPILEVEVRSVAPAGRSFEPSPSSEIIPIFAGGDISLA